MSRLCKVTHECGSEEEREADFPLAQSMGLKEGDNSGVLGGDDACL